jgi:hypothetical protein
MTLLIQVTHLLIVISSGPVINIKRLPLPLRSLCYLLIGEGPLKSWSRFRRSEAEGSWWRCGLVRPTVSSTRPRRKCRRCPSPLSADRVQPETHNCHNNLKVIFKVYMFISYFRRLVEYNLKHTIVIIFVMLSLSLKCS